MASKVAFCVKSFVYCLHLDDLLTDLYRPQEFDKRQECLREVLISIGRRGLPVL